MRITSKTVGVKGTGGAIRCLVVSPVSKRPSHRGVLAYSDIFQLTPSFRRTADRLASHGFVVVAPELYGRFRPAGTAHDFERDRQAALDDAARMALAWFDEDRRAVLDWMAAEPTIDDVVTAGWCIGGHLALRAALEPDVKAAACCYATGVHSRALGQATDVDTIDRFGSLTGELLLVWGRQDPHIPAAGRAAIHRALDDAGARFEARFFDAEHAFMRDEGPRSDPAASDAAFEAMLSLFHRT